LTPFDDDEASTIDDRPAPWRRDVRSSDGVALLIAVLILAVVSLLGATLVTLGNVELALSSNYSGPVLPPFISRSPGFSRPPPTGFSAADRQLTPQRLTRITPRIRRSFAGVLVINRDRRTRRLRPGGKRSFADYHW